MEKKLLHYIGKAIADYKMIRTKDRVMVCLSGGKDSYTMVRILNLLRKRSGHKFELFVFTLDQAQPGWNDEGMRAWLEQEKLPYLIFKEDTYSIVKEKIPEGKTYCSLCSRLRRGIIYRYAEEQGYNKVALGHHRDDMIRTLLMSIFYNGEIKSMPPKLLSDNKRHIVIRPLAYCQENDIIEYAKEQQFPIIPCNLCGAQENLMRQRIKVLIDDLAKENPKIPSNMLHALTSIKPSQLMDKKLWDFYALDAEQQVTQVSPVDEDIQWVEGEGFLA
ncbi:tRNA 2-thiocytidine biosynthesis protein TtcA [Gammaproteobacteria bacterium SCGC AG-212-F23]|nr:tRNA 2-thiocytidine biosynthesis protein TtcA [Gammaproteobacteria bacterium SCGC AG-212-F23]